MVAEAAGTGVLIIFGDGVCAAAATYSGDPFAKNIFIDAAWGLGVAFGVLVSFDVSGAHLNPVVTLQAVLTSGLPVLKGLEYVSAQVLGAFLGAIVVTVDYVAFRGGRALSNFYCTSPAAGVSTANAFFDEFVATSLLLLGLWAIADRQPNASKFHVAGCMGLLVMGIGLAFPLTGFAINPARDLGPRLCWLLCAVAYGSGDVWWDEVLGGGYFLVPILAPLAAAVVASAVRAALVSSAETRAILSRRPSKEDSIQGP